MTNGPDKNLTNTTAQKCVLLVEDDRSARRFLEIALQRSGYQVITAADGLEALKLSRTSAVDAVVTDAIMPHLSGRELARFLRQDPKLNAVPIVLLTGQENKRESAASDDVIDAVLIKPIKQDQLAACLTRLWSRD